MRKETYALINKILFIVFFIILVATMVLLIQFCVFKPKEVTNIVLSAVGIIISLPTIILTFLSGFVFPRSFNFNQHCQHFSDRREIIKQIITEVIKNTNIIKISGTPNSGISELLGKIFEIRKDKKLLEQYTGDRQTAKLFKKSAGECFYLDGKKYQECPELFKQDILKIINKSKIKKNIVLLDHVHLLFNPYEVLEFVEKNKGSRVFIICDIGTIQDKDAIIVPSFNNKNIEELAQNYSLVLSQEKIKKIEELSWGNVGLLNILFRNLKNNFLTLDFEIDTFDTNREILNFIEKIINESNLSKLAVMCATLNYCTNEIDSELLSKIFKNNIYWNDIEPLTKIGLFQRKGKKLYSNDYFSFLIRACQYKDLVALYKEKILDYYVKIKDNQTTSIMLLCKNELKINEITFITSCLKEHSAIKDINNIRFIKRVYIAYSENNMINFAESEHLRNLEEEIIYQYASVMLHMGQYKESEKALRDTKLSPRLLFLKADLLHLENQYDLSIGLLSVLIQSTVDKNILEKAKLKLMHCYKHVGDYDSAFSLLNCLIADSNVSLKTKIKTQTNSLSLYILTEKFSLLEQSLKKMECIKTLNNDQYATLKRYKAVMCAYNENDIEAFQLINEAITLCESMQSRLVYNCYYIRGEINRHFSQYSTAYEDFLRCYNASLYNGDYNLRSMAVASIELIKPSLNVRTKDIDIPKVLAFCQEKHMVYNAKLLSKILQYNFTFQSFPPELISPLYIVP